MKRRWKILGALGALPVAVGAAALVVTRVHPAFGQLPTDEDLARHRKSPNWRDGRFVNPIPTEMGGPSGMIEASKRYRAVRGLQEPRGALPVAPNTEAALKAAPSAPWRVTWMGHTSVLVELDGVRVLADPVWSERVSPFDWVGPARFHPTPLPIEALPPLDAVIISHDHHDHLDPPTIRALDARGVTFHVPLGIGAHLRRWGVPTSRIVEQDWWEARTIRSADGKTVELVATPARHFSGRAGFVGTFTSQWSSWALIGPTQRLWFGGDTGYWPGAKEIGERLGPFDLTLMPIGAYDPAWSAIHVNPEEAVQLHKDVRGGALLPTHWATFNLAPHAWDDPPERLLRAAKAAGVPLHLPVPGQPVQRGDATHEPGAAPWWRAHSPKPSALP